MPQAALRIALDANWITAKKACELLGISKSALYFNRKAGKYSVREVRGNGGRQFEYLLESLPLEARQRYAENVGSQAEAPEIREDEAELAVYSSAPEWSRRKADKYANILQQSAGLKGSALREFINQWNSNHPEFRTSYPRVVEARNIYEEQGLSGLLGKYGKTVGRSIVPDAAFKYFCDAYLKEGAPSLKACWVQTLGDARRKNPSLVPGEFPNPVSFLRRLEKEMPESAIYMARHGKDAWNRKYASYIERDYSTIRAGECAVGDHHQIDVAVMSPEGKPCFPWLTNWVDFKTTKWLGWLVHCKDPNSDHVFQSFYRMSTNYGLVSSVYIDNGKDYRCRDFAGGRKVTKVALDTARANTMLSALGIEVHYAAPYNAQAKIIERQFLRLKEYVSKQLIGYRGGDVTERPECLKTEIKTGTILKWEEFVAILNMAITEVINRMPSNGKELQGMSPDQFWEQEAPQLRRPQNLDALKLFCMRTSRELTIGRNGISDSEIGMRYWAEWMSGMKGTKVYMRRDPDAYQAAWVFRAADDEYLGKAQLAEAASALARTDVEKEQLRALMAAKRSDRKIAESYISRMSKPSAGDVIANMAAGAKALGELRGYEPKERPANIIEVVNTAMDRVLQQERSMQTDGRADLSSIMPNTANKEKVYLFETDKEIAERGVLSAVG